MTEIIQIYKELYAARREYCVLCFRSGSERRLGGVHWLRELAASLGGRHEFREDFQKLCFVCESRVRGALRLHKALRAASAVHAAMRGLAERDARGRAAYVAPSMRARLAEARAPADLVQTEVLAVHCGAAEMCPSPRDVFVLPDAPPSSPPSPRAADCPEMYVESVTLDGGDSILVKRESSPSPPGPAVGLLVSPPRPRTNYAGAASVTSPVPTITVLPLLVPPPVSPDVTSVLLNRLLADYSLQAEAPPDSGRRPAELFSAELDSGSVQIIMEDDDEPGPGPGRTDEDKRKRTDEERERRPTDWEDKIPMDVISFMNATDPNAASVLAPPRVTAPRPPASPTPPIAVIAGVCSTRDTADSETQVDMDSAPTIDNNERIIIKAVNRNSELASSDRAVNGQTRKPSHSCGTPPVKSSIQPLYRNVRPVVGGWRARLGRGGRAGRENAQLKETAGAPKTTDAPSEIIDLC